MEALVLRPASRADVPALLELMTEFNAFEGIPYAKAKVEPALVRLLDTPSIGFVRVATRGPDVVGYVIVTFGFDLEWQGRDAFVTELFVAPAHRRSGIARALLERAELDARANEVRALHLVVRPENASAIGLYTARGFSTSPRRVMTKELVEPEA